MRILYAASDQRVPGTTGGSIHVVAVAEGLAALGHEVHALVTPTGSLPDANVHWIALPPPAGRKELRWANTGAVRSIARHIKPDVVIERYYNFGGEGVRAAAEVGALAVLEVNAPVIDYPGSGKRLLDRALIFEPMRRWREYLCSTSDLIVTPSRAIVPPETARSKILELEWGADTDRFRPGI
ncbi:MAG: glycosyltransferase family 4 protein, partial [Vicinamibacterales bacterium]